MPVFAAHASAKMKWRVTTYSSIKRQYDVYINEDDGNSTVKRLKRICRINGKDFKGINVQKKADLNEH